jgi:hypothetical protein
MSEQLPVLEEDTSTLRRTALVAVVLMIVGATIATVGIMLAFSVPVGLVVLGTLVLGGGILLGLTS